MEGIARELMTCSTFRGKGCPTEFSGGKESKVEELGSKDEAEAGSEG